MKKENIRTKNQIKNKDRIWIPLPQLTAVVVEMNNQQLTGMVGIS